MRLKSVLNKCPRTKESKCQCDKVKTITEAEETIKAMCVFEHKTEPGVLGFVRMKQKPGEHTVIEGIFKGLTPGLHGFHIHEFGDLSDGCKSAGGHYNPHGVDHGDIKKGHVGDLGNVEAGPDGVAKFKMVAPRVDLSGEFSVVGRAFVIHADPDDLGQGGDAESLKTGNAGDRLACGVIRLRESLEEDIMAMPRNCGDLKFDRNKLPQVNESDIKQFQMPHDQGYISIEHIKPVQSQRVPGYAFKVFKNIIENQDFHLADKPLILDSRNHLLNGHHRYDVARTLGIDKVKVIRLKESINVLIKQFNHLTSERAVVESWKLKVKKLTEIKLEPNLYKDSDPKDNSYITDTYKNAVSNSIKYGRLPGITNSEMYDNGHTISIFIVENEQPIFLLNLKQLADGYSTVNVVSHSQHRGKGFAIPIYLAVSKHFGDPLYSFGSQSSAGNRIWEKLYQQYPNRIKAVNVKTNQELDVDEVLNDNNFETRIKLLPESVNEGDVVPINKAAPGEYRVHSKPPYFSDAEAERAADEYNNQAQIDQEDGVLITSTDGKNYRIFRKEDENSEPQHFEPGEVYLVNDYETNPKEYVDKDGYPDVEELLYHHSKQGYYVGMDENFADGKKKGKSRPGRVKRAGASCKGSVTSLRAKAKKYSGERGKMYHWCANMKSGKKKTNEAVEYEKLDNSEISHFGLGDIIKNSISDQFRAETFEDKWISLDLEIEDANRTDLSMIAQMTVDTVKNKDINFVNDILDQFPSVQLEVVDVRMSERDENEPSRFAKRIRLGSGIPIWKVKYKQTNIN